MPPNLVPADFLDRLIAVLVALFGASARVVGRIAGLRGRVRDGFVRLAAARARRGYAIAYLGEDAATVDARVARMEWIARDPVKAMKHLARQVRGLARVRLCAEFAPVSFAPPTLACAVLDSGVGLAARAPDT